MLEALAQVLQFQVILVIFLAALYGVFMGAIPGLTATMAVALLVPVTFFLNDVPALAAIVTLEACAIFAGDIPTALLRIPGTPSSAAYVADAYALTQQGRARQCLLVALVFSVAGGLFGAVVLISSAPWLARLTFYFSTYEFFWLILLGLTCGAFLSRGSALNGLIALFLGLLLAAVGLSRVHNAPRLTFGFDELLSGISFLPAMIGLFGVSEVFKGLLSFSFAAGTDGPRPTSESSLLSSFRELTARKLTWLRSSAIGAAIGMLPGAGADIAAWISLGVSKRVSKNPHRYGTGSLEAVASSTAANNAALAGSWIPALVFGIPGDSITAIVIGVLLMKNITPGPRIFTDPDQSVLVYSIYWCFILANLLLIPVGLLAVKLGTQLVRVPRRILLPLILLFCFVGSFAIRGSYFDVWVMLAMGLLGLFLEARAVPLGPVVLGIILGGRLEETFVQSLSKSTTLFDFVSRPAAALLACACLVLWVSPWWFREAERKPSQS